MSKNWKSQWFPQVPPMFDFGASGKRIERCRAWCPPPLRTEPRLAPRRRRRLRREDRELVGVVERRLSRADKHYVWHFGLELKTWRCWTQHARLQNLRFSPANLGKFCHSAPVPIVHDIPGSGASGSTDVTFAALERGTLFGGPLSELNSACRTKFVAR